MNLEKAIESNRDLIAQPWLQAFPEFIKSVELGNEALKIWKAIEECYPRIASQFLPGETED